MVSESVALDATKESYDSDDIHSAAVCAWKEARGEGVDGMCGVLHILKNRVDAPGFARTLHEVIYGKNQFTSMSVPSDPEFDLKPADNDPDYKAALELAMLVFSGDSEDPTKGSHYYANLHEIDQNGWFYKKIVMDSQLHPIRAQIKHHTFFA